MKKRFPKCEKASSDKLIPLQENKSKCVIENPNKFTVYIVQVDGCAIKEGLRCDYLVFPNPKDIKKTLEIYIELKGSQISHAIEQLEATMRQLSDNTAKAEKVCIIVSTRCPITGTDIQNFKTKFKKTYNAKLEVKNKTYTYCLS